MNHIQPLMLFCVGAICGVVGTMLALFPTSPPVTHTCQCEVPPYKGTCLVVKPLDQCVDNEPLTQQDIERIKDAFNDNKEYE